MSTTDLVIENNRKVVPEPVKEVYRLTNRQGYKAYGNISGLFKKLLQAEMKKGLN